MILLMSLYQLIFLDKVPEYAIIDEAVKLAKKKNFYCWKVYKMQFYVITFVMEKEKLKLKMN